MTTRSLRRILSMQAIVVVITPFVIMLLLGIFWLLPQLREGVDRRQIELASVISLQVDSYLATAFTELRAVASFPFENNKKQQHQLDSFVDASISFKSVYLVDHEGRTVAVGLSKHNQHTDKQHQQMINLDLSRNPLFRDVSLGHDGKWSDTFLSLVSGGPAVGIGMALGDNVVIGELDLERLLEYLQRISISKKQLVMVLDSKGQIIADRNSEYTSQQLNISNIPFIKESLDFPAVAAGRFQFAGSTMIGTVTPTHSAGWAILVAEPLQIAYGTAWTNLHIIAVSLLAAVLFGVYVSLKLSRKLANRFTSLTLHARRLAHGEQLTEWPQFNIDEFDQLSADLQQMAGTLQASESRFRAVTETAPDAIVSADAAGRVVFYNRAAGVIFGYTEEEALGQPVELFMPERYHAAYGEWLERWQASGVGRYSGQVSSLFARRKDGSEFPIEFSLSSCPDRDGMLFTAIIRDITERRLLEEKLLQSLKMESVGRLAGGVAHDFNNKLAVILGYAEMSKLLTSEGGRLWENLHEIAQAAAHSRDITSQLLSFSRQQVITLKSLNLNLVIASLQRTLPRLIGEDITVNFNLAEQLHLVKMDATQADQIVMNLAINARDAMPDGGVLTLATANITLQENYSSKYFDAAPGSYVQLCCSDSGSGMDEETLRHIYEPFYTTKEVGKGTGLGLATIFGIVSQNDGYIEVDSQPGQGSVFRIYLPVLDEPVNEPVEEHHAFAQGSGRVLLVEDEDIVRNMVTAMLVMIGYSVTDVGTPAEALALCADSHLHFDLVMTDVVMPAMNGKAMVKEIEKLRPGIKVLFMSGYTDDIISEKGLAVVTAHFIHKPFNMKSLSEKINEVMTG